MKKYKEWKIVGGGVLTLYRKKYGDDDYVVGWSLCSPNDVYDEARGRLIARGRAKCGRTVMVFNRNNALWSVLIFNVMACLDKSGKLPSWVGRWS